MPRIWCERISAVAFIAFAVYMGRLALEFPAGGGTFPLFATGSAVVLSVLIFADTFIRRRPEAGRAVDFRLTYANLKPVLMTVLVIVYVISIFELGYFTASVLFLLVATVMVGIRNYRVILLTCVILFPLMYVFFEVLLKANLPRGILV